MLCGWWVESDYSVSLGLFIMTLEMTDKGKELVYQEPQKDCDFNQKIKKIHPPKKMAKDFLFSKLFFNADG